MSEDTEVVVDDEEVIDNQDGAQDEGAKEITFEEALEQVTGEKTSPVAGDESDDKNNLADVDGDLSDDKGAEKDKGDDKDGEGEQELSELDRLRRDNMRLSGHASKLQRDLNQRAKVVRQVRAPVIDDKGVFTESFKELQKEFPEADFGRVEDIVVGQNNQINQLSQEINNLRNTVHQSQTTTHQKEMRGEVLKTHSDFDESVRSPEFGEWQKTLPPETQQMILSTNDPNDINVILDSFKSATGFKSKATQEAESRESTKQAADKRTRRNSASVGVTTKQPSTPITGLADGFNEDAERNRVFKTIGIDH